MNTSWCWVTLNFRYRIAATGFNCKACELSFGGNINASA
jgi:hypothetical protein